MATQVQFRRGTKTEHNIFTGANAEVTVNTTNKSLHVHDGVTAGGVEVARADLSNHSGVGVLTATTFSGNVVGNLTGEVNSPSFDTNSSGVVVTGVTTSTSGFVGNLTGNVTGNLTGEVNAAAFDTNSSGVVVTGVTTSTSGFVGNLTGDVTGNSDTATALETPRTFEITGDIVASAISFDGSGNVSLAATIQPNSVGLGTDTTGEYVSNITGTANQITVTSGIGEGSTPTLSIPNQFTAPQDVTVTRDLLVERNLNVSGNITIGGTSASLFTTELKVYDPDIVLGIRTDGSGNDISTDNTANHGGIAVASTEGTPLISLYDVGIGETNPATYKKIMWFKSGTFSGLGTDAWLINYGVGIGSTQVPNGVRLAAGGMQVTDSTVITPQLNVSGIVTAASFSGPLTGNVTGTATSTTNIPNLSGDITSVNTVTTLATVNSNVGTFGSSTSIPSITVNAKGLITGVTTSSITSGITITDDTSTNETRYLTFTSATTGSISGQNVSSTKLTFNPSTGQLTATDINSSSDIRLKEDVESIENALEIVQELRGVRFKWKENKKSGIGVIAQEIEKVVPEVVSENDNIKSVSYGNITAILIEAIKDQQIQINSLKEEINLLKGQL